MLYTYWCSTLQQSIAWVLHDTFLRGRAHVPCRAPAEEGWLSCTPSPAAVLPAGPSSMAWWAPGTAQPRAASQGWQGLPGDVMGLGPPTFGSRCNSSLSFPMSPTNLAHRELIFTH